MSRADLTVIDWPMCADAGSRPVRFRNTVGTTRNQHPLHRRSHYFRCSGAR
jgi:hypothetical protein